MGMLQQLKPTIALKDHISVSLQAEFAKRLASIMKNNGIAYIGFTILNADLSYTILYTDTEIAEVFYQIKSYHAGIAKMQLPYYGIPANRMMTEEALSTLEQNFNITDSSCSAFTFSDHSENLVICAKKSSGINDNNYIYNYDFASKIYHQIVDQCADLIEEVKKQFIKPPFACKTGQLLVKLGIDAFLKKESRKATLTASEQTLHYKGKFASLNETQLTCLMLLLSGESLDEIAEKLEKSKRAVEKMIDSIKKKLNCLNRDQLIEAAMENNLLKKSGDSKWT